MDFLCYLHDGWQPLIRPAEATRAWMDATPAGFAYRCLPLNIANAAGWEILTPVGFAAYWRGGAGTADVIIHADTDMPAAAMPVSLFGQATLTIHIQGLFRTPPGWNLFAGGCPNRAKDGIAPLAGIIETDWAPYTFTMNWRFTRRNHWVRFEASEPICFIQPTPRDALENMQPKFVALSDNPDLSRQFAAWSQSRNAFQSEVAKSSPAAGGDQWQKRYYRGLDMDDKPGVPDHRARLRLQPFVPGAPLDDAPLDDAPLDDAPADDAATDDAATAPLQVDPTRLERALEALAAAMRSGRDFDVGLLTAAGLTRDAAERIARSARPPIG